MSQLDLSRPLMPGHSFDRLHTHRIRLYEATNPRNLARVTRDILDADYGAVVRWWDTDYGPVVMVAEVGERLVMAHRRAATVFIPEPSTFVFSNALRLDLFGDLAGDAA